MAILVVDNDPAHCRLLEDMLQKLGHETVACESGDAALSLLAGSRDRIDCVILDLVMPKLDGMGVLARLRRSAIKTPVIVQTADSGINEVVSAMRAGAVDFVVKPVGAERLQVSLRNALNTSALEGEIERMKRSRAGTRGFADVITRSPVMAGVIRMAEKAAASSIPVLISGESGVGKELIARAIHGSGKRRTKPFVAANCGAMPENLVESILFGHERGAFSGATERHVGKFVEASGGTLFLDEVSELPPAAQLKLLRSIQHSEVEPVGARKPIKIDVRILAATTGDLIAGVKAGRFREDLFDRLGDFPISVPALRERPGDIAPLARHFLARFAAEEGKRIRLISPEALRLLMAFPWPGNIRQLENAVFRAVVLAEADSVGLAEFPQITAQSSPSKLKPPLGAGLDLAVARPEPKGPGDNLPVESDDLTLQTSQFSDRAALDQIDPAHGPNIGEVLAVLDSAGEVRSLEEVEADLIRFAISHYRGQMSEVARRLRISRSTLYRKLESLGLTPSAAAWRGSARHAGEADAAPVAPERQPRKIA